MQARRLTDGTASLSADRRLNQAFLTATFGFSVSALAALTALGVLFDWHRGTLTGLAYGICLLCCSFCSWYYNVVQRMTPHLMRRRQIMRLLDHAAIFLLIAGTYTPFVASGFHGPFGIGLLEWVWALAVAGIILKMILRERYDRAFIPIYLALGWLFLFDLVSIIDRSPFTALVFLVLGGIAYTGGAAIFWRGVGRWTDAVWHGCVLIGVLTHFAGVLTLIFVAAA
ncbi:hemolysin III family protein [Dongia soli]|uniref:Hemolysin III family protein n=1 Tax=Dongia soli TaxID=600628 RepID=A0ABU5EHC5_9PROT|nr:hemolysin III family protein [Dongia soli]MDY0884781.1 hemolysin III family protein [Dongia soli]